MQTQSHVVEGVMEPPSPGPCWGSDRCCPPRAPQRSASSCSASAPSPVFSDSLFGFPTFSPGIFCCVSHYFPVPLIFLGSSHSSVSLLSCHFLCTFFICVCLSLPVSLSFNSCHLSVTDLEHRINSSLGNLRNFSTQYLARDFIPTKSIPSLSGLSITLETIG